MESEGLSQSCVLAGHRRGRRTIVTATVVAPARRHSSADQRQIALHRLQRLALRTFGCFLLAVVLVIALFPPYFMTITAFHPPTLSFNRTPTLFSTDLTLRAFVDLFEKYPFAAWMANTVVISVSSTVVSVSVATLAAYSLSRLRYPGRQ